MGKRRERGRLGARGVGECEVEFEWVTMEKDQRYRSSEQRRTERTIVDMRRRMPVRERSQNISFLAPSFWEKEGRCDWVRRIGSSRLCD
jgi:hypothetical protein